MSTKMTRAAVLLGATLYSTSALTQTVDEVIVLSSPFQKSVTDVISTTEIVSGDALAANADKPIGDLLSGLPGVDSAGYGPAVGQPIIRGLGGYRVDVLQNGMTVGDIAPTGGDHANAVSLFDTDRVEVLKGPAALRYGAFAATGVVNSFNRHMAEGAEDGSDIAVTMGDVADETISAFFTRRGNFALSAFSQDADNMTIPTHAESDRQLAEEGETDEDKEQEAESTFNESRGFTVSSRLSGGASKLSLMLSSLEMDYGVPGHSHGGEQVSVDLEQQTLHAKLTHQLSGDLFNALQADITIASLEQDELADGAAETEFEQDSTHIRVETSGTYGGWQTLLGVDLRETELTAKAEEHDEDDEDGHGFYLPNSERSSLGLFAFAERDSGDWLTELAFRFDDVEQKSMHDEEPDQNATVSHDLTNLSAGLARKLDGNLLLGGSVSATERAPSQVELFAEGEHVAAARHEEGDPTLGKESALATELYLRRGWNTGSLRFALFNNDYSDFIYLKKDSEFNDPDEPDLEGFTYEKQDAELSGYELQVNNRFMMGTRAIDATFTYSEVTGELADGGNLPAIPPQKIGLGLGTRFGNVGVNLDVEQASDQTDTAEDELATDGHTAIDLSADWTPPAYEGLTVSAAVRNVTDEEIRHHTSPLKDLVPEAGQDIRLSLRYRF